MSDNLSTFAIVVLQGEAPDGPEVRFLADGVDLLDALGPGESGLEPTKMAEDLTWLLPKPLAASAGGDRSQETPPWDFAVIGICDCRVYDCGDTLIHLSSTATTVTWTESAGNAPKSQPKQFVFSRPQYVAEIARALADFSWETPAHTIARIVGERIDRARLAALNLAYAFCRPILAAHRAEVSLSTLDSYHQLFITIPLTATTPDAIADEILSGVANPPSSWPAVEYMVTGSSRAGTGSTGTQPLIPDRESPTLATPAWTLRQR